MCMSSSEQIISPPPEAADSTEKPNVRGTQWRTRLGKLSTILTVSMSAMLAGNAVEGISQQFAPSHISTVEQDGAVDNGTCAVFLPGVMFYTEPDMQNSDGLLQRLLATTEHVTAINYEGSAADMDTLATETAEVIKQQLADCQNTIVFAQSFGGFVAVEAIARANLTDDEKRLLTLVIDDSPSGSDTMKPKGSSILYFVKPGPMANLRLSLPLTYSPFAPESDHTFSFTLLTDQLGKISEGIPNTDALKGVGRIIYVQAYPKIDQQVVQPDAREDWMEVLPDGTELVFTKGQHANYREDPRTYNLLIDDMLDSSQEKPAPITNSGRDCRTLRKNGSIILQC